MTLLLTLFFVSLLGIIGMVGRKLSAVPTEAHKLRSEDSFEIPHFDALKDMGAQSIKKYAYATLVLSLKLYIRSTNILKYQYQQLEDQIKHARTKHLSPEELKAKEDKASRFLDLISEYKYKIRKIKRKIAAEEKSL